MGVEGIRRVGRFLGWFALLWTTGVWAQASSMGQWGPVETWPVTAAHAHMLPTGKVLFSTEFDHGGDPPYLWDPTTDAVTQLPAPPYNIFCAGHVFWPDGRLFIMGGHISDDHGLPYTVIFNPFTLSWSRGQNMNAGRWYPTGTALHNGDVLIMSGNTENGVSNLTPQVFELGNNRWRTLTGAAGIYVSYYPQNFAMPNGNVLMVGPGSVSRVLNPNGTGAWVSSQSTSYGSGRNYGTAVMYQPGKVVLIGGGVPPTNNTEVIDGNQTNARFRQVQPMVNRRRQAVGSLMPDGKVLVVGGHYGNDVDDPNMGVYTPEVWDPNSETWSSVAQQTAYRGYHSTLVLLPDGRFLSAGSKYVHTMQVYSPAYLFKGSRPVISSAPNEIQYNTPFTLQTPDSIARVTLVRLASVTHALDENQRFNSLNFQAGDGQLTVMPPTSDYYAPPGHYMLFVLNGSGVPSVAKIVHLAGNGGSLPPPPPDAGTPPPPPDAGSPGVDAGSPQPPSDGGTPSTGSPTFSDEFPRVQSIGIGNNWTTPLGRWRVNQEAISDENTYSLAIAPAYCGDCTVESRMVGFKVATTGLALRVQSGPYFDRYEVAVLPSGALQVRRVRSGVTTVLGTGASGIPDLTNWAKVTATILGDGPVSIAVMVNGTARLSVSDSSPSIIPSTGFTGIIADYAGVPFDSFKTFIAGSTPPPPPDAGTPPPPTDAGTPSGTTFSDNFNRANSTTLGTGWTTTFGAWILHNQEGQSDRSGGDVALENHASCANCTVSGRMITFGVPTAGLVLRSSSDGQNRYEAVIDNAGKVEIRRVQGGVATVLNSAPHGISDLGSWVTLSFTASGSSFTVKVNGVVKVTASDSALAGAGLAGMTTSSAGVPFDDFSLQ